MRDVGNSTQRLGCVSLAPLADTILSHAIAKVALRWPCACVRVANGAEAVTHLATLVHLIHIQIGILGAVAGYEEVEKEPADALATVDPIRTAGWWVLLVWGRLARGMAMCWRTVSGSTNLMMGRVKEQWDCLPAHVGCSILNDYRMHARSTTTQSALDCACTAS